MKDLLARMAETYDVIIFDSPPILALWDATVQSSLSNQTLMIVRSQLTPLARPSIQQIEESGGRVMGVVLNCVRPDHMGIFASGDRSFYKKIQKSYYHRS